MIPRANITAWRKAAPWPDDAQVEQDLVLCRALVEMFRVPLVADTAVFRGGTALHKLFFDPPGRYSEDIDLVQREAGPIGPLVDAIRGAVDPWLGNPKRNQGEGRFTLRYRFETSFDPVVRMRVKIEINTREHFSVRGFAPRELIIRNPWYSGRAELPTYELPELLGTKLRALYQRRKGRDLFDLWLGLEQEGVDRDEVVSIFQEYMRLEGARVTRAHFEANMSRKMEDAAFLGDLSPLLRQGIAYRAADAWDTVYAELVSRLPGGPWKGRGDSS